MAMTLMVHGSQNQGLVNFNNSLVLLFLCNLIIKGILITYWMELTCQKVRDWQPKDGRRLVPKKV